MTELIMDHTTFNIGDRCTAVSDELGICPYKFVVEKIGSKYITAVSTDGCAIVRFFKDTLHASEVIARSYVLKRRQFVYQVAYYGDDVNGRFGEIFATRELAEKRIEHLKGQEMIFPWTNEKFDFSVVELPVITE